MEIKYCFLNLLRQKFGFFCKSDFWSILFGTSIRTAFLVSIRKFCGKTHSSTKNQLSLLFFGVWENKNFGLPAKKLPEFDGNNFDRLQKITYHIFKRTVREKKFFFQERFNFTQNLRPEQKIPVFWKSFCSIVINACQFFRGFREDIRFFEKRCNCFCYLISNFWNFRRKNFCSFSKVFSTCFEKILQLFSSKKINSTFFCGSGAEKINVCQKFQAV